MNHAGVPGRSLWIGIIILTLMTVGVSQSEAGGYKTVIGGVTVSYSGTGALAYYYNWGGGTNALIVEVAQSGGSLKISVGPTASSYWGGYVDVLIFAYSPIAELKSITIKGQPDCRAYIAGEVGYVSKLSITDGVVGDTDYYGYDQGLWMAEDYIPASVSMKSSWATAQVLAWVGP